jgi:hypothetical protein
MNLRRLVREVLSERVFVICKINGQCGENNNDNNCPVHMAPSFIIFSVCFSRVLPDCAISKNCSAAFGDKFIDIIDKNPLSAL